MSTARELGARFGIACVLGSVATLCALSIPCPHARGDVLPSAPSDAPEATAEDPKATCLTAYENTQLLRMKGSYLAARDSARSCARTVCLEALRADCLAWYGELDHLIPTVVFGARSERGEELDVRVSIDGKVVTEHPVGTPFELDPGPHTFTFELPGWPIVEQRLTINTGEKSRSIRATFAHPVPKDELPRPPPIRTRPIPTLTYAFGGVAIGGLVGFSALALSATLEKKKLERDCAPFCSAGDATKVTTQYVLADVSLAISVLSVGAAAYFYWTRPTIETADPRAGGAAHGKAIERPRLALSIAPLDGGAFVQIGRAF